MPKNGDIVLPGRETPFNYYIKLILCFCTIRTCKNILIIALKGRAAERLRTLQTIAAVR